MFPPACTGDNSCGGGGYPTFYSCLSLLLDLAIKALPNISKNYVDEAQLSVHKENVFNFDLGEIKNYVIFEKPNLKEAEMHFVFLIFLQIPFGCSANYFSVLVWKTTTFPTVSNDFFSLYQKIAYHMCKKK